MTDGKEVMGDDDDDDDDDDVVKFLPARASISTKSSTLASKRRTISKQGLQLKMVITIGLWVLRVGCVRIQTPAFENIGSRGGAVAKIAPTRIATICPVFTHSYFRLKP